MRYLKQIAALCFWFSSVVFAAPFSGFESFVSSMGDQWNLSDVKVIMPDGKTDSGSISVMDRDTYFYYPSIRRDIVGSTLDQRLLVNVVYARDDQTPTVVCGTLDLDGKKFYPLFLDGGTSLDTPPACTLYLKDDNAITALILDGKGEYQPAYCRMDNIGTKGYTGCKALPSYQADTKKKTISIPFEFANSSKRAAGDIIVGVVIQYDDDNDSYDLDPIAQIYWQAVTPYKDYSKAQLRTRSAKLKKDKVYYAGTIPDQDISLYVGDVGVYSDPINNLFAFLLNSSTPLNLTVSGIIVKGIFSSTQVIASVRDEVGDTFDFITDAPMNYLSQKSKQKIDPLSYPFSSYSPYESWTKGCSLYHSDDWQWHYQVCSSYTNLIWPVKYLGQGIVRTSADFYRDVIKADTSPDLSGERMQLQHVGSGDMHYGVIRSANKDDGDLVFRIKITDTLLWSMAK